jgi:hypothetical protein
MPVSQSTLLRADTYDEVALGKIDVRIGPLRATRARLTRGLSTQPEAIGHSSMLSSALFAIEAVSLAGDFSSRPFL